MKLYDYTISNSEGLHQKGKLAAANREDALLKLREIPDSIVISVTEHAQPHLSFFSKPRLSLQDKLMFTKNMAAMMNVGITINEALKILGDQARSVNQKRMYENIQERIQSGQNFASSLRKYEAVFSEVFVNMVETGEASGTLEDVFEYLGVQLEKEYDLRKKVVSAFIYPAVIIGITILMMFGIVVFIMPRISSIFTSFNVVLPLPTRIMIGTSDFILNHPLKTVALFFGSIAIGFVLWKSKTLKPLWGRLMLHVPVFGTLLKYVYLAVFSRTMNSLLQAGVPITDGLKISSNMMSNAVYKKAILLTRDKVEQGGKIGESFQEFPHLFPPVVSKMLHVGEITGSLESTTGHLAELYEREVDGITKNLSVLLEPILLVFMGIMIGGIAISIILPIYQLPNMIQR